MAQDTAAEIEKMLSTADGQPLSFVESMKDAARERLQALEKAAEEVGNSEREEMRARLAQFQEIATGLEAFTAQERNRPTPSADDFIIHGSVFSRKGTPKEFSLVITDTQQLLKERIPAHPANENGYFTLVINKIKFRDLFEKQDQLVLRVVDRAGKPVFAPKSPIPIELGKVAIFSTVVP